MRNILITLIIFTFFSLGCGNKNNTKKNPNTVLLNSVFSLSDVSWFYKKGNNTLIGQAFIRTKSGEVITCAGYEVELYPYSSYTAERMKYLYGNKDEGFIPIGKLPTNIKFFPDYPEFKRIKKKTLCDANGIFKFQSLPDGKYYIVSIVYWETPTSKNGGFLMKKISLKGGEIREIILTRHLKNL